MPPFIFYFAFFFLAVVLTVFVEQVSSFTTGGFINQRGEKKKRTRRGVQAVNALLRKFNCGGSGGEYNSQGFERQVPFTR